MNEEKNIKRIIEDLKNLPKVEAPQNFESDLRRKLNSSVEPDKHRFRDRISLPGRLFPGALAVSTAIVIFFLVDANSVEFEDPLNLEPKLREDLITLEEFSRTADSKSGTPMENSPPEVREKKKGSPVHTESYPGISADDENKSVFGKTLTEEAAELAEGLNAESLKTEQVPVTGRTVVTEPAAAAANEIGKDNLNFMQINLSARERQQVEQLKQRVQSTEKAKTE